MRRNRWYLGLMQRFPLSHFDSLAFDGDGNWPRTSDSQRSCAIRLGAVWSLGLVRSNPPVATALTTTTATPPTAAATSHARRRCFRGAGGELSISHRSNLACRSRSPEAASSR